MQKIYKIFLTLLIIFIGFSFYGIDWQLGILHEENTKYIFSIVSGILGIILIFVLDAWSKISLKNKKSFHN